MRTLQYIENQFDNVMKALEWNKSTQSKFTYVIKHPLIITEKSMIPQWKFCTVNGDKRCTDNIGMSDIIILDFDDPTYSIKEFEKTFREFRYVLHTSHSYDGTNQKFRVFLFLNQEYDLNRLFFKCHNTAFSPYHMLINYFNKVDKASFVRAQFFKLPAIKEKGAPYYYKFNNGRLFNPYTDIGFEMKMAYEYCVDKQEEYLKELDKENQKYRSKFGKINLTKAREYIAETIENTPNGERHNQIFSLACWFKRIGGTYDEFEQNMPSWADGSYNKQMKHIRLEWARLR
jgi:hypothetical protein